MAHLRTLHDIVDATLAGSDGAPPLYAAIVHLILPVIKNEALATRLPATVGFSVMLLCLLAFARRRLSAVHSFIAVLIAAWSCFPYATEGRSYGLVLGCAAAALGAWQAAADRRRRPLNLVFLAVALAFMVAFHYYAIFFLLPLTFAETVRLRTSRQIDFTMFAGMLAALLSTVLVLYLHASFIQAGAPSRVHFWSPATWAQIPQFYTAFVIKVSALCLLPAIVMLAVRPAPEGRDDAQPTGLTAPEWAAIALLAAMPALVIALSRYTTHVFVDRYVLWASLGFAILLSALLQKAARAQTIIGVAVLCVLLSLLALREVAGLLKTPRLSDGEAVARVLSTLPESDKLIVIVDSHAFMELSYYARPQLRPRLAYIVNPEFELTYLHRDTESRLLASLGSSSKLAVITYKMLIATYPDFLLVTGSPIDNYLHWELKSAGYRAQAVNSLAGAAVLHLTRDPSPP